MSTETIIAAVGVALLVLVVALALWDAAREEKRETEALWLLFNSRDLYGHEMVRASNGIGGQGLLQRGTIYVILGRLEQQGLVSSVEEPRSKTESAGTGIPRRLYSITHSGRVELQARARLSSTTGKKAS